MNIVSRVKNILLTPVREWGVIDGESATVGSLYTQYALILAAIPVVIAVIAAVIFHSALGLGLGLLMAIVSYVIDLALLYVVALIINALAPSFGGQANFVQALKVTVYSSTAMWIAAILGLIPIVGGILALVVGGIYTLVLYWLGLPKMMKVPEEKKAGFNIVVFVCIIVLKIIIVSIITMITLALVGGVLATMGR
ncbi:MAG: YIP1 family protein [Betaproteobacteria bacterium]|nr:YIP1 family protein [Betaproteobacteria bacterium]